jgi:hypothetical protein
MSQTRRKEVKKVMSLHRPLAPQVEVVSQEENDTRLSEEIALLTVIYDIDDAVMKSADHATEIAGAKIREILSKLNTLRFVNERHIHGAITDKTLDLIKQLQDVKNRRRPEPQYRFGNIRFVDEPQLANISKVDSLGNVIPMTKKEWFAKMSHAAEGGY